SYSPFKSMKGFPTSFNTAYYPLLRLYSASTPLCESNGIISIDFRSWEGRQIIAYSFIAHSPLIRPLLPLFALPEVYTSSIGPQFPPRYPPFHRPIPPLHLPIPPPSLPLT